MDKITIGEFERVEKIGKFVSINCCGYGYKIIPTQVFEYAVDNDCDIKTINWDPKGLLSYILLVKR